MNKQVKLFLASIAFALLLVAGLLGMGEQSVGAQGGVTGFANLRITNFYRAQPRTALTVTMNGTVNSTGTYQRLTAAGAVATSGASITVKPAGTILTLINVGSNTITFTETGTLVSAGNIALGANDAATLYSDGTNWYQVSASNN